MRKIIILVTIIFSATILIGAGCMQKQKTNIPSDNEQTQAVEGQNTMEEKNEINNLNVSKDELDKLKNEIQALDVQDLNTPKN